MSIAGSSVSLIKLLQRQYYETHGDLGGFTFRVFSTADFSGDITDYITMFLYRVDVDRTKRHYEMSRSTPQSPRRTSLALELRYLLTVWGTTAEREQEALAECMEILDQYALLSGELLDPDYAWEEGTEIKISLESISNEDMLRLWDSLEPAYRLSVPYLVRTVLLSPLTREEAPLVDTRTNVWTPALP
ncbi:MAG: DUF4255 domain-containing protein [Candidatus Thiodiazotropha sp. (ex Lucinoma borealis)]|nr:DUF4255 domain-containing protein [Candidatus Thiodiazotropha sp. (ex Lucinoma borealis)]